ncbi:class I SAM-dependent methyltransferase [Amycolatopsis mongoliensis]|uniref:Class I SAM-dependent methyltransferase n=1 Tax=Amycolatopsis mongoliensis TaxID=715475 RepID=A0A9Y2JKA7_9PSEU|nr:class I SAM-dependent methyltransferase [Amycolatopsis sp. 4-36]WIX98413.1 class I SAM-dependent methyltransferase [Amycolatopsis sp. 4-36]
MATTSDVRFLDQRTPEERDRPFLPGAGKTWLLPFYDVLTRFAGVRAVHERLAGLAGVEPGQAVVDVGCGTANLSLAVLAAQPGARLTGLDPDRDALRRGMRKARRRGVALTLVQGYADRIPAEDASLDHVISSLALHHLDGDSRAAFARDAFRALRPGGKVTIADFGGSGDPAHGHGRHLPRFLRFRVERNPQVAANHGDGIVALLADAGFGDAREAAHADHRLGRITFVQATRPSTGEPAR